MDIGKHPYIFYLLSLVLGIFICEYISFSIYLIFAFLGAVILFSLCIVQKIQFRVLFSCIILICWMLMGILLVQLNVYVPANHYIHYKEKDKIQCLSVIIKEQNNSNEKNRKYTAEVKAASYNNHRVNVSGNIMLLVDKERFKQVLTLGNEYTLLATIKDPPIALNPHQFNYEKYLNRNYILQIGKVEKIISESIHTSILYKIKNFNQTLIKKVDDSNLSDDSKEFLKAFLLGDRSEMKRESIEAYSKSGIMHLIAISGMHIAFIFSIMFNGFSLLLRTGNKKRIIIISLLSVWFFGCLVGLSSSVFRSCLMITIYYFFELLKRTSNIYHSMSLSAIIILVCDPYEIYSIGFQLSYVAVFFISWLSPAIIKYLNIKNRNCNEWFIKPLSVTLAAQLGTLPFVLFYFNQFTILSIPINILVIPYTFIITYSSIVELFIVFLPLDSQLYFSFIYDFLIKLLVDTTRYISSIDVCMFTNIPLNIWELTSLVLVLVFIRYYLLTQKLGRIYPILICLLSFQLSVLYTDYNVSKKRSFIVFHNKNVLLGFREGKKLLIIGDSTGNWNTTKIHILHPYITGERINTVEYKILDNHKIYKWEENIIQVVNKINDRVLDSANFVITTDHSILKQKKENKFILTGNAYLYKNRQVDLKYPSNWWITAKEGAFMISF